MPNAVWDYTERYRTVPDLTGPYWTLQDLTRPYWTIMDLTGPYRTVQHLTRAYGTLLDLTGPYFVQVIARFNGVTNFLVTHSLKVTHAISEGAFAPKNEDSLKNKDPSR